VPDLVDVLGQYEARRALEISAAGGHHMYLQGAPGAGKTMLAERLPGILPPLSYPQALEVSTIHSVAAMLRADQPLISRPPFCAVHHTATVSAMVGGGSGIPKPGAVSRAHHGILFLDEAPEFSRPVLDALREPIESGQVIVARASGHAVFPAKFLLIAAANPCPCGRAGTTATAGCACTSASRRRYLSRLSGPLLDRIDLRVGVHPVGRAEFMTPAAAGESTAVVAARVRAARARAAARLADTSWTRNAEIPGQALRTQWRAAPEALVSAERALERGTLTARGVDRVLRIAWTVADLAGHGQPDRDDVDTALGYRLGVTFGGA
jgi:magnesium chelatase family protein